ncbi:MAG: hypothetical protein AB8G22_25125 [Saprospiraceae bacterium]
MKLNKLPILVCGLTLILTFFPNRSTEGCGWSEDTGGYSFINPLLVNHAAPYAAYFLDFEELDNLMGEKKDIQPISNIDEWYDRFCEVPIKEDIRKLIYTSPRQDFELLKSAARSESIPLPTRLNKNSFARHLESHKCLETIDYLIFAKTCEPHVTNNGSNWETPQRDVATMTKLIKRGIKEFKDTKSHYIRLRYAYQLVRLAHYSKQYEETLRLYDWTIPKMDNDPSLIEWWMLGHKAGALQGLGRNVEAAYHYAQIFQHAPSKRQSAFRSFSIETDAEWAACLNLCQNDHERATLFAMRASAHRSQILEEVEKIYDLDPTNENLELLIIAEIKRREEELLGRGFSNEYVRHDRRHYQRPNPAAGRQIIELQKFARKLREEEKTNDTEFWHLAEGYLEFLAGDFYAADRTFKLVSERVENDTINEQLQAFRLALSIAAWEHADDDTETKAVAIMRSSDEYDKYRDFPDYLHDKMAQLYRADGQVGKAFLCHYPLDFLRGNPQEAIVNDLMQIYNQAEPSRFEQFLLQEDDHEAARNTILDIRGTMYLQNYQLEAALEIYKDMEPSSWDQYCQTNPFREHINDCVNCNLQDTVAYNRKEIIERILEMEYSARAELERAALYYYRIGNAFYNMTYFGHAWRGLDYFRSGASYNSWNLNDQDGVFNSSGFPYGNKEIMDVARALSYFERVKYLTTNRELLARATFAAAKCEQKQYFMSDAFRRPDYSFIPEPTPAFFRYHQEFLDEFSDTQYYLDVIQECKYFNLYAVR